MNEVKAVVFSRTMARCPGVVRVDAGDRPLACAGLGCYGSDSFATPSRLLAMPAAELTPPRDLLSPEDIEAAIYQLRDPKAVAALAQVLARQHAALLERDQESRRALARVLIDDVLTGAGLQAASVAAPTARPRHGGVRSPDNPRLVWRGVGRRPAWLRLALVARGFPPQAPIPGAWRLPLHDPEAPT